MPTRFFCVVCNRTKDRKRNPELRQISWPWDKDTSEKWRQSLGVPEEDLAARKRPLICSLHFYPDQLGDKGNKGRGSGVLGNVVPRLKTRSSTEQDSKPWFFPPPQNRAEFEASSQFFQTVGAAEAGEHGGQISRANIDACQVKSLIGFITKCSVPGCNAQVDTKTTEPVIQRCGMVLKAAWECVQGHRHRWDSVKNPEELQNIGGPPQHHRQRSPQPGSLGLKFHSCVICGKQFAQKFHMMAHQKLHSQFPNMDAEKEPMFQCKNCYRMFTDRELQRQHERSCTYS